MFSVILIALAMLAGGASWINPFAVARMFDPAESGFFVKLVGAYMAFQIAFGCLFGLLIFMILVDDMWPLRGQSDELGSICVRH
jgi:hypothetical protein